MQRQLHRFRVYLRTYPLLTTLASAGWNLACALFNGALGLIYASWWFITLCVFHAALGLLRLYVLAAGPERRLRGHAVRSRHAPGTVMRKSGIALIAMSIVAAGMITLTIREQRNPVRNTIVMIAMAAYTFTAAGLTIRNAITARRTGSYRMITLRNIACAGTIGAMLSLERAMLGTFGSAADSFTLQMEAATGAGAFVLLIALGLGMVLRAGRNGPRGANLRQSR